MCWLASVCLLLGALSPALSQRTEPPNLAGSNFTYILRDPSNTSVECLHASFKLNFRIIYVSIDNGTSRIRDTEVKLPDKHIVDVDGECGAELTTLKLSWFNPVNDGEYEALMAFNVTDKWRLSKLSFTFTIDNTTFETPEDEGLHTYTTPHNESLLFNRTFSRGQYFYCKNCKTLLFTECANNTEEAEECTRPCFEYHDDKNKNVTRCASLEMMQAVIFPGDFHSRPKKKLCMEDYIAQQEIIVPVVVGGILSVLLAVIFLSYVIAYAVRRRKEAKERQYEPLAGTNK